MIHQNDEERWAFCETCPQPEDVSNVLASLGCSLAFTMPAEHEGAYMHLPPLPAQFHYEGPGGLHVALYFAWSFYPFGEWVGNHFLQDAPGGPGLLGLVSAAILGGCVLIVVFYKEYIKEDTEAYSLATCDESFMKAFQWFSWFVLGLEPFSVLFRAILLNFSSVAIVMLGVGVLGMAVTYIVGKILHVQMNRPPSVAAKYMREEAGRSVFEEGHSLVRGKKLTTAQKRQIAGGDPTPIDHVRDEKAREREREVKAVQERRRIAEENDKAHQEFYQKMIATPDTVSSNGHVPSDTWDSSKHVGGF
jgi:hypothetical protein